MGLCFVLAATPGANLAVVLRCAGLGGQRAAVGATAGLVVGKVFWAVLSLLGLAALLAASATAYQVARLLGAAYLVWLGVQALRSARRHTGSPGDSHNGASSGSGGSSARGLSAAGGFRRGVLGDVLNPKVGLFYTTVFPQFLGPGDPLLATAAMLLVAHAVVLLLWYPSVSAFVLRAGRAVGPQVKALLERMVGVVLIALGVRLAATAR
jgi:threonine/homoserine/homoserine lactone efflux protein